MLMMIANLMTLQSKQSRFANVSITFAAFILNSESLRVCSYKCNCKAWVCCKERRCRSTCVILFVMWFHRRRKKPQGGMLKRQSNCLSPIMMRHHIHSYLSWFSSPATALFHLVMSCLSLNMQCLHYSKNLCVEKLKWNWNCYYRRYEARRSTSDFFLLDAPSTVMTLKPFVFICGDGLTRSIHVRYNYYDYHYLVQMRGMRRRGIHCHHVWKSKIIIIRI